MSDIRFLELYWKAVDIVKHETGLRHHRLMRSEAAVERVVQVVATLNDPDVLFYKFLRPRDATGQPLTRRGEPAKGTTPTRQVPWARIVWPTLASTTVSPHERS